MTCCRVALVGTVSRGLKQGILAPGFNDQEINVDMAIQQHINYVKQLADTECVDRVYQIGCGGYADGVFVEDPVVVVGGKVGVMGELGVDSRKGEGELMEDVLRKMGLIIRKEKGVKLEGGDVIQMEGWMFVGISERTQENAVVMLQKVCDEVYGGGMIKVRGVKVKKGLHLKSSVTWMGNGDKGFWLVGENGEDMVKEMEDMRNGRWEKVEGCGNGIWIASENGKQGRVLVKMEEVERVESVMRKIGLCEQVVGVMYEEFVKLNGSLSCMSVIV